MELWQQLGITTGVTAVIGSGGKTSLLQVLGQQLSQQGRVVLCTTTKIKAFPLIPHLHALTDEGPLLWAGTPIPHTDKFTAPPWTMAQLSAVFDYILVEADGSAGHPFKAHLPHEPVIPPEATQTICLVGLTGFGKPIGQAVHRPTQFSTLCNAPLDALLTPQLVATVLQAEGLHTQILCNQADTLALETLGQALASLVDCPTHFVSLKEYLSC